MNLNTMRFPCLILLCLLFPFVTLAQYGIITGKVVREGTTTPLPRASVFLSNSAVGSATQEDGSFILSGIRPGQYTLVVTILGYEEYSKVVLVGTEPIRLNIEMKAKPLMLREVVIQSAADWKKNYEMFRKAFIGSDDNAKYCDVINPHILNITYNPTKRLLHADADEFLIVENKALGYRVKFLVTDFNIDEIAGIVSSAGERVFEELPGSESQKKRWHQKREEAYYGSSMHFYRSLYQDKLAQEGFIINHLSRQLNPIRPPDEEIRHRLQVYKDRGMIDSARYLIGLANMSKYYRESLMKVPLNQFEIFSNGSQPGLYAIHFSNYLYVIYTKKTDDTYDKDIYRPMDQSNYAVSVVTLNEPYAEFDKNGIVINGGLLYEGTWSRNRLSDLLPVDYVPDND